MRVQERQWLARFDSFHPEVDLAEFHGHGVDIHAVDAVTDYIAQGGAAGLRSRFLVAGTHSGKAFGDAVGGCDQEVSTAAGWVADFKMKDSLLRVRLCAGFRKYRLQSGIEQTIDQAGGRIVATSGLAFIAAGEF